MQVFSLNHRYIHDIDLALNRRINNAIKKLKIIKNKLNDLENERTKVIEEEIKVWKGENVHEKIDSSKKQFC